MGEVQGKGWKEERGRESNVLLFQLKTYLRSYLLFMCVHSSSCAYVCAGARGRQKRTSGLLELELQAGVSYILTWELSLGPLKEQCVLITTDPSLQLRRKVSCSPA